MTKFLLTFTIFCLVPTSGFAHLGGAENGVANDKPFSAARHRVSHNANYTVHEITGSTIKIKEYVSLTGVVFAVSWRGVAKPDLTSLLGPYFVEYDQVNSTMAKSHTRNLTVVKTARAVVKRSGHPRDWKGIAVVPDLVPNGVNAETLQ